MAHVIEPAPTGRARCRACGVAIVRGELRCGEGIPNPFGDGEAMLWFHPTCAAHRRPAALLEAIAASGQCRELGPVAERAVRHRRLPRIAGGERASSARARCRCCRAPIVKGAWRIKLVFFEADGRFSPGGFVHLECRREYFECEDAGEAVLHFSQQLGEGDRAELAARLASG